MNNEPLRYPRSLLPSSSAEFEAQGMSHLGPIRRCMGEAQATRGGVQ